MFLVSSRFIDTRLTSDSPVVSRVFGKGDSTLVVALSSLVNGANAHTRATRFGTVDSDWAYLTVCLILTAMRPLALGFGCKSRRLELMLLIPHLDGALVLAQQPFFVAPRVDPRADPSE